MKMLRAGTEHKTGYTYANACLAGRVIIHRSSWSSRKGLPVTVTVTRWGKHSDAPLYALWALLARPPTSGHRR